MIPRIIHQIWVGGRPPPTQWLDTWPALNPEWQWRLWDEAAIAAEEIANHRLYAAYLRDDCPNGAANVARVEILERYGGFFVDADTECIRPLEEAWWWDQRLIVVREPNESGRVANGFIGAAAGHPLLAEYRTRLAAIPLSDLEARHPSWKRSGPAVLSALVVMFGIVPLSADLFMPLRPDGSPWADWQFGIHHWHTTRNLDGTRNLDLPGAPRRRDVRARR